MIYVSCGHEKGIGLEVFLKSYICLNSAFKKSFVLVCSNEFLNFTLTSISMRAIIHNDHLKVGNDSLKCEFLETNGSLPLTTVALDHIMKIIKPSDILVTLPSIKNHIYLNGKKLAGHTEYFRCFFKNSNLTMNFLSAQENLLLLSDHVSLQNVHIELTKKNIIQKVTTSINGFPKGREINEVLFSGIDPHCGEFGQISSYDNVFTEVIDELNRDFKNIKFSGPFAGDTLHFKFKGMNQLFVYAYHDQGLAPFKLRNGLVGINLTLGMPFKRVSVDHGTAPDIFGKNIANYQGMLFLLNEIESW